MRKSRANITYLALSSLILTACGGGSESGGYDSVILPSYGSIAIRRIQVRGATKMNPVTGG
jgi:hypothetical protein